MTNKDIQNLNVKELPIYLISFNRLSYLKEIIVSLENYGLTNIHIIDNASTYPPLLEYLKQTPYQVHRMDKNYGHLVFFEADEFKEIVDNEYYVLSDPDIIPVKECPTDFMQHFFDLLLKYRNVTKVGFSLKTDDISQTYSLNETVVTWEKSLLKKPIKNIGCFAPIDTTFAMYRPKKDWKRRKNSFFNAIRTAAPYEARHLPWYKNLNELTEEDKFYNSLDCGSGTWNGNKDVGQIISTNKVKYCIFRTIPVLTIRIKNQTKKYCLFGFLPILNIETVFYKSTIKLFDFIPLITIIRKYKPLMNEKLRSCPR